jgi:4-hydroxybutyrate coenzyme A transferase
MTDYQKMYQEKLTTPDKIARQVQSGWLLGMDTATSQTPAIMTAIAEYIRSSDITGVKVQALLDAYPFEFYTDPTLAGKMTGYSWFSSSAARKAVNAGYADIIPAYYRDFPTRIRAEYDYDAVCVEVAPMDRHGYFSLALNGSYIDAMLDKTKRIFLEVNDRQPRGLCGSLIHISQVDAIVEYNHDLPVLPPVQLDEVSKTIGGLIAERIPDGACLQLGIGAIPDATGMALKAKHDLGIHTEMFTDSMVELIECGAVNNSKKQIHRGKTVTTFAFGSQRIYDYIDDNPAVEILPVEYVNDPDVICQNDNMISINAAVEVDLFGQVCAESVGTKHMSGSGGQIDYVRGACQSRGGKSFIAFTSTAKGGTISKIKPILTPGAVVTTSKNDVDYIVTEYGVAHLRGRSLGERARQLIAIAHPDFRDELTFEAKKRGIMI